jgi:metallo-beta-lactamase class B
MLRAAALILLSALCAPVRAQYAPAVAEWNRPAAPFRIAGNLYYVGAADVSAFLIATPQGHILLDTGFRETVPLIEANLKTLGFRLDDVHLLLISHGHYDHVGGVAEVKRRTHARLLANPAEAALLGRGGKGDFAFGDKYAYPPVQPDAVLRDGEAVHFGGAALTPHFTPGHTQGCTSWTASLREGEREFHVAIPCSLSAPGYKLVDNPLYPGILRDYERSIATLRALPCDIFLAQHSWDFDLPRKIERRAADPSRNPFVDPEGYRAWLDKAEAALRKQADAQRSAKRP